MPVTHTLSDNQTYFLITIVGRFTLSHAEAAIDEVILITTSTGITKVLVDARAQAEQLDTFSAHHIGLALAQPALRGLSIAVVVPDPLNVPHHIETVAQNRGRNVRYFNDIDQARAWLGVVTDDLVD